ncbi:hypothetical protein FGO68_gene12496 [Halteria grandinella]|uniref:Uncharacterized protein n=1 Tax=Halteria grandinella TaxID=5974 RepID=A0A8J8TAY2_HALGN|nr:hypothetical protein FGO68_gene12496 [Halteria grandinella]
MIMFLLILFLQAGFFIYWIYQFMQEFKLTVLVRYPRIYTILCACKKGQSVSLEIEEYKAKIVAPFVEKLQRLEECKDSISLQYALQKLRIIETSTRKASFHSTIET